MTKSEPPSVPKARPEFETAADPAAAVRRLRAVTCVLFDLDGTLIDTVELILTSFRYATTKVLGAALPDEMLMRNVGMPLVRQMQEFAPNRADELLRVYREHNAAHHDEMVREYPGVEHVLESLQAAGYAMGVVTSKGTMMTMRGLARFGLERFFRVVVTADDVPTHKPAPYPLLHAAELLGVEPGRCAYVGDSPHDMLAAIAARVVSAAALWGAFPAEQVLAPGPDYALEKPRDVLALLDGDAERFALR